MAFETELEEKKLLYQVSYGDRKAFTLLYTRYIDELYQFVFLFTKSKEYTGEILQELFVSLWERKEMLREVESIKPYLFRSAKNKVISGIRHEKVKQKAYEQIRYQSNGTLCYSQDVLGNKEDYSLLRRALDTLPPKRRLVVQLKVESGLSLDEIASKMQISKKVVKKQLYKGVDSVRQYLLHNGEISYLLIILLNIQQKVLENFFTSQGVF